MTDDELREEVRAWLAERWDRTDPPPRKAFLEEVVDAGWATPSWPTAWFGRGLPAEASRVVAAEFRRAGAPGSGQDMVNLWANTVLAHGTDELRKEFLRPLLLDEVPMCLLYSEPGAGSDLAGLQTRAERDGDEWVVNGQKVWTSEAHKAAYGMLIARTDWDVPKHQGITFFWFPMRQPGVEVRPLRQITGDARFNEVFITDGRVPDSHRLGEPGGGWRVLQTALAYERVLMGGPMSMAPPGQSEAAAPEEKDEKRAFFPLPDLSLVELARRQGKAADPVVRQELARLHCLRKVNEWNTQRAAAELQQGTSSSLASLGKLAMAQLLHVAGRLEVDLLGAEGTLAGAHSRRSGEANYSMHNAYFFSIGGGTDQIQRNIIGERILGLPKEPDETRAVPFRQVRQPVAAS